MQKRSNIFLFSLCALCVLSACESKRGMGNDNVLIGDQSPLVIPMSYDLHPPATQNSPAAQNTAVKDALHKQIFGTLPKTPEHMTRGERSFIQNLGPVDNAARNNLNTVPRESQKRFLDTLLHKQKSNVLNPYNEMKRTHVPRTQAAPMTDTPAAAPASNSSMQTTPAPASKKAGAPSTIQFIEGDF
ncbi:MAG: hypothetical protein ACTSXQ_00195 [Alphaproteobacteria bacterium]